MVERLTNLSVDVKIVLAAVAEPRPPQLGAR
jgi:hypothetical protein